MSFHYISFRTYVHATEDQRRVEQVLRFASGAMEVSENRTVGFHGNPIVILQIRLEKEREMTAFFSRLSSSDLKRIMETLDRRVDERCSLYFRLDKQSAALERLELVDHDDVIQVSAKIESYPRNRERAIASVEEFISSLIEKPFIEN